MIDLDKLETIARAATPEEWECGEGNAAGVNIFGDALWVATVHQNGDENEWDYISPKQMMKNATFIATANPTTVLELIAELRQTRKERDWLAENMPNSYSECHCPEGRYKPDCNPTPTAGGKVCYECLLCWLDAAKEATSKNVEEKGD